MIPPKVKIGLLVAIHIVCGVVLAWLAGPMGSVVGFYGLSTLKVTHVALLGIWAGLSTARLGWRLIIVLFATAYGLVWDSHYHNVDFASGLDWTFYWFLVVPVAIFGILSALRFSRRKVHLIYLANALPPLRHNQFSIRHVLLATAVVASVLGLGRAIRTLTDGDLDYWWAIALNPPCATLAPLAMLWATLGLGRPLLRLPIGFLVGFLVMFIPGLLHYDDGISFVSVILVGLHLTITAASLLVFRSCGWRLVSGAGKKADETIDGGVAGERQTEP